MTRTLTDEQEQAVSRRREPLLLAAGAGSGKTSVLVERFVRAVLEDELAPGRILAITFTERAAGELRERVRERFLQLGEREAARDTEAAFVSTYHGFCARLLRAHPLMAGLDPDFTILEEGLARRLRERAFTIAVREFLAGEPAAAVDLLAAYGDERVRSIVLGVHAELRSRGERLPGLRPRAPDAEADDLAVAGAAACEQLGELLSAFGYAYEELKRARGAVDFDDLELCARELLQESESVRTAWSERFELLMVDEFQDTNPRQLAILRALERSNLFTVGDELQSIYGFRHADVRLFRSRRAELDERGASLCLAQNFRGRAPLLDVVNAVFAERLGTAYTPLLAGRADAAEQKEGQEGEPLVELLLTDRSGWDQDERLASEIADGLPTAQLWRAAEARMLAQRVADLVDSGQVRAGEVVVLLRALGDVEVYEHALQLAGLRTLAAVGGFWGREQVEDLLAYLRTLANPLDEPALYATLASPLVGVSSDGLALLARSARASGRGVWETMLRAVGDDAGAQTAIAPRDRSAGPDETAVAPPDRGVGPDECAGAREHADAGCLARISAPDRRALAGFCEWLLAERRAAALHTISRLLERAIEVSGYREHVLGLEWGERRLANVHKLLRLARRYEASEGRDLRGFLEHAASARDAGGGGEPDAPVAGVEPDAVRLMTVHAAKGLEFPVVCVADLGRAPNLAVPDLLVDGERIGLRLVRLDGGESTPSLEFAELSEERRRAQAEEEQRILYVAMTRASERLLLSAAVEFEHWPEDRQSSPPIAWLGPTLAPELPALVQTLERPILDLAVGPAGARVRCWCNAAATIGAVMRSAGRAGAPQLADGEAAQGPQILSGSLPVQGLPTVAAGEQLSLDMESGQRPRDEPTAAKPPPAAIPGTPARAAVVSDGLGTLSYSSLSELERCGYRYYLERVLGLREDRAAAAGGSSGHALEARARGTLVHRLLETFDFARPSPPSPADVGRVAHELGLLVAGAEREEIAELVGVAGQAAPAARVAAAEGVLREYPFAFSLGPGEPLITGVIDVLTREADGGWLVLDYKSDRVAAEADLEALVERDYGIQRLLYALAALRAGAPRVEVLHWFLQRPHDPVGAGYGASERRALERSLAARIERARVRGYAVSAHPHRGLCLTCPGRAALCSWSRAETLREDAGP